jgi:hypothetical protein
LSLRIAGGWSLESPITCSSTFGSSLPHAAQKLSESAERLNIFSFFNTQ